MFIPQLIIFHVYTPSVAPIPEAGQASVQPHPAHPGSQGRHEEQPLNPQSLRTIRAEANDSQTSQPLLLVYVGWLSATCLCLCVFRGSQKSSLLFPVFLYWSQIYLTFVPCSEAAYSHNVCLFFVLQPEHVCVVDVDTGYYSMHIRNMGSRLQRFKTFYTPRAILTEILSHYWQS